MACDGCDGKLRLPHCSREAGTSSMFSGAKRTGWQLEPGLRDIPHGVASNTGFPGSYGVPSSSWPSFLGSNPEPVGRCGFGLLERPRSTPVQKAGDGLEVKAEVRSRGGVTVSKKKAKIPKGTKGPSGPGGELVVAQDGIHASSVQSKMTGSADGAPLHGLIEAPFDFELTHPKWCAMLVSQVLRGRCPFSSFVASSKIPRSSSVSSLPMFPIPVPPGTHFDGMTPDMTWRQKKKIHLDRVVHILVMAHFLH